MRSNREFLDKNFNFLLPTGKKEKYNLNSPPQRTKALKSYTS